MNLKFEILEISPRIKYLKCNQTDIISVLLHSGKNITKIYDIEKSIKEKQKNNLLINRNNLLKLTLIRNNTNILGVTEFSPSNEIKWLNLHKDLYSNDNLLTISSHKIKSNNLNNYQENSIEKYNNYYLNTNTNTIDLSCNIKQPSNLKATINYADAYINSIKIKVSMKINSIPKINKNISIKTATSLTRGGSQILLNISDKNRTINKNIPIKNQNDKMTQNINSMQLKKKLKNVKSSSSIKIPFNNFIRTNKFSLNTLYANINSNNKSKIGKNNNNQSLLDKKQKTQYNFTNKKSYLIDENEKTNIINPSFNNNTITFENNNKKIEDLIIDNNFKNKLKSDEIINPDNYHMTTNQTIELYNSKNDKSLSKTNYTKSHSRISTIKREISKEITSFYNYEFLSKENSEIKVRAKKRNASMNIPDVNYNFPLFNGISKIKKNKSISSTNCDTFNKYNDDDSMKYFEKIKNDIIFYYTKEYLNSLNRDGLLLELNLFIEKIFNLKIEYQNQYNLLFNSFINHRKYIKLTQKKSIIVNKKNNKLQSKKLNNIYLNDNIKLFSPGYKQFVSSGKLLFKNNEFDIWGNFINLNSSNLEDIKKTKMNNLFLKICERNINNLNSLSRRYYLDIKQKKEHQNNDSKEKKLSELSVLVTIQNNNNHEIDKEENNQAINNLYNTKTSKNIKKSKKFYQNLKTTTRDDRKNQKYSIFLNSKSTEKKKIKKEKFPNKI